MARIKAGSITRVATGLAILSLFRDGLAPTERGFPRTRRDSTSPCAARTACSPRKVKRGTSPVRARTWTPKGSRSAARSRTRTRSHRRRSSRRKGTSSSSTWFWKEGGTGVLGVTSRSPGSESHENDRLAYVERIVGDFTLAKRAQGFDHVLMVGTGTGLAPFVSMIKQLHHDARGREAGAPTVHAGARQPAPSRSWPTSRAPRDPRSEDARLRLRRFRQPARRPGSFRSQIGSGRANNLLRHIFDLPAKDAGATPPALPRTRGKEMVRERIDFPSARSC